VESWIDPEAASATGTYNIAGPHFGVTQCWKTDKDKNPQTRTSDVKDGERERQRGATEEYRLER
jgi:hypothetical protein